MSSLLLVLWIAVGLCFFFNFTVSFDDERYDSLADDPSILHTYNRFAEIEQHCNPFQSSASDLKPDDTRGYRLKNELNFFNGDWKQENGGRRLMPFDDSDFPANNSSLNNPLKLANFDVVDVNAVHRWKNVISLIGVLSMGITTNTSFGFDLRLKFNMMPGLSVLSILFEGVYIESDENGGERLLCLLGNSTLPYNKWTNDPLNLAKGYWSNHDHKPRLLQDDQILLILQLPQTFNLTRRAILGEMRSLNDRASLKYFDKIQMTSQLGHYSKHQFSSELLNSITCSPYVYQEELMEDGAIKIFISMPPTRTGLSGMTLSAEGIWNPSSGQLCMVGCLGMVDSGLGECNSQISLYFPRAYSIKQRSMIYGSISSINDEKDSFLPILFDAVVRPGMLKQNYIRYVTSYPSYNYSKIDQVDTLRKRKPPTKFLTIIKHSLLKYPILEDQEELFVSLNSLSYDFEIDAYAIPDSISAGHSSKIFVLVDVLSLGPLFGRYDPWFRYVPWYKNSNPPLGAQASLSNSQLLNVSMHLSFTKGRFSPTTSFNNLSELYLEGLYDPLVGQMYLIGCRKVMVESISLE
ncbi:DUF2921 family protein [Melia azedarach]|uniref:DUF2921 family protein n=1 Tax=Melia azedarach TaxID=155640 RepID=A0ACC1XAZ5_MELAZ|nr:DUF2921 family protein [Melia azedarach]